jgi:pilus assembly protein CpaB
VNRNRLIFGLGSALILAFLLSAFVYRQFKRLSATSQQVVPTHYIVVADEPLQLGTRLTASNLRLIPWPASAPVAGMFTRIEDCVNHALITPVAENEPILADKLASIESGAGLPATIPEGMRAVSVAVNEVVGVAGFVTPGKTVDVLVTGSGNGSTGSVTRTILENIRVLAAGQKIEQDQQGKPETAAVITLLVTPEDASKLTMASTVGKIQLALRNTIDTKTTNPEPMLQTTLFGGAAPPPEAPHVVAAPKKSAPAPAASPIYTIEVITGGKRELKSFPSE